MAGFFGTPTGIIASDENIRRNVLTGMEAAKTLGEIEMQPAQKSLLESHGRLYKAEAEDKEAAARTNEAMLQLQSRFMDSERERQARTALIEQGASQGRILSVEDVPPGGFTQRSQADQLRRFAEFAEKQGVGPLPLAKVYKEIAEIDQKEAAAGHNRARQGKQNVDALAKQMEVFSQVADTAAASLEGYMSVISNPQLRDKLPPGLTGNFKIDRPILQAVARAGQDTIARARLEAQKAEDADQAALRRTERTLNDARVKLVEARTTEVKRSTDAKIKNGGENSPEAREAKQALKEARNALRDAKIRKDFPPAPLDPKLREIGKSYTAADGVTRFMWTRDPATGQNVAVRLSAAPTTRVKAAPVEDDDDDDGEE